MKQLPTDTAAAIYEAMSELGAAKLQLAYCKDETIEQHILKAHAILVKLWDEMQRAKGESV